MVEYKIDPGNNNPKVEGQAEMILAAIITNEDIGVNVVGDATLLDMTAALGKLVAFAAEATHVESRFVAEVMTEATFTIAGIDSEGDE